MNDSLIIVGLITIVRLFEINNDAIIIRFYSTAISIQ